jgi:uncharacterized membrane protein
MSEALALPEKAVDVASPAASAPGPGTPVRLRVDSIDLLRGLVMVTMALDHTRDYFSDIRTYGPENLYASSFPLFMTRWITHFCAPTFVFLAGTGAFIFGTRVGSKKELAWFLLSRGLWLVILELTLTRWSWNFTLDFLNNGGAVIWAIGWSMVCLSGLVFLPTWAITLFGVLMICVHNLFDTYTPDDFRPVGWLWSILHSGGLVFKTEKMSFAAGYPLVPWIGVMAAGYGFGTFFLMERAERRRWFWAIGLALTLAFIVLRGMNSYGDGRTWSPPNDTDAQAWSKQMESMNRPVPPRQMSDAEFSICSFLNCSKYPPSLLYLLMTLGPAIAALAVFDRELGPLGRFFVVFGRVPLFYYLLHLPLIHGLMLLCDVVRYHRPPYWGESFWGMDPAKLPPGYGYSLPIVYLVWIAVVLLLYPLCRWYADYKRRHRSIWLSYL